ncbi:hypothetical protein ACIQNU_21040 [Streptomyces sp. NPDC091292]|uniref:COG4315 family predicted lipoprotein n=1 Tax=Streptomyces sp. NPDC091292 TaxID=3365991 RepID=UPI003806D8AA
MSQTARGNKSGNKGGNKGLRVAGVVAAAVVVAALVGGCSSGGGSSASSNAPTTRASASAPTATASTSPSSAPSAAGGESQVTTATGPLGTYLVDGQGRTLYLFEGDKSSKSSCYGNCAKSWPPAEAGADGPSGAGGVRSDLLGTSDRDDGTAQITYNGHPLYRFSGDLRAGTTAGEGSTAFGASWYMVDVTGKKIEGGPTSSPSGSTTGTGGY